MSTQVHCPRCHTAFCRPRVRDMPDGVSEHRCPDCGYQLPLLVPGQTDVMTCPHCSATGPHQTIRGVDPTGLLNLVACSGCRCVLGRYWGLI